MVHCRRTPTAKSVGVTGVALTARWYVDSRLGKRVGKIVRAVMASGALSRCSCVIHAGRFER